MALGTWQHLSICTLTSNISSAVAPQPMYISSAVAPHSHISAAVAPQHPHISSAVAPQHPHIFSAMAPHPHTSSAVALHSECPEEDISMKVLGMHAQYLWKTYQHCLLSLKEVTDNNCVSCVHPALGTISYWWPTVKPREERISLVCISSYKLSSWQNLPVPLPSFPPCLAIIAICQLI